MRAIGTPPKRSSAAWRLDVIASGGDAWCPRRARRIDNAARAWEGRCEHPSSRTGAVAITHEEIEREKKRLPFGWGRFGKAYDQLAEISESDESLLAAGVALNPEYHQGGRFVPGTLASAVYELRKTTNVLVACTNQRLIMMSTGVAGGVRDHVSISYERMAIVERARKYFVIGVPEGRVKIRGMAKQQQPRFLEVLEAQARPTATESA